MDFLYGMNIASLTPEILECHEAKYSAESDVTIKDLLTLLPGQWAMNSVSFNGVSQCQHSFYYYVNMTLSRAIRHLICFVLQVMNAFLLSLREATSKIGKHFYLLPQHTMTMICQGQFPCLQQVRIYRPVIPICNHISPYEKFHMGFLSCMYL